MAWSDKIGLFHDWTVAADPDEVMAAATGRSVIEGVVDVGGVELELQSGDASKTSSYDVDGGGQVLLVGHVVGLKHVIRKWRLAQGKVGLQVVVPAEQVAELRAIAQEKGWQIR